MKLCKHLINLHKAFLWLGDWSGILVVLVKGELCGEICDQDEKQLFLAFEVNLRVKLVNNKKIPHVHF